ncbi:hypothetical protein EJ06DRAFT_527791 [Trichodelitschia bisporula]|uniref:Uncharacterized protein n=1 Tax=Trichodelitschia bisporula TaxID=703511 RepID=A0A6G1I3E4_9PEZI|nr:hypothetical protein EJ06DRAFT_527791 [Trichodelitschia bisporula]
MFANEAFYHTPENKFLIHSLLFLDRENPDTNSDFTEIVNWIGQAKLQEGKYDPVLWDKVQFMLAYVSTGRRLDQGVAINLYKAILMGMASDPEVLPTVGEEEKPASPYATTFLPPEISSSILEELGENDDEAQIPQFDLLYGTIDRLASIILRMGLLTAIPPWLGQGPGLIEPEATIAARIVEEMIFDIDEDGEGSPIIEHMYRPRTVIQNIHIIDRFRGSAREYVLPDFPPALTPAQWVALLEYDRKTDRQFRKLSAVLQELDCVSYAERVIVSAFHAGIRPSQTFARCNRMNPTLVENFVQNSLESEMVHPLPRNEFLGALNLYTNLMGALKVYSKELTEPSKTFVQFRPGMSFSPVVLPEGVRDLSWAVKEGLKDLIQALEGQTEDLTKAVDEQIEAEIIQEANMPVKETCGCCKIPFDCMKGTSRVCPATGETWWAKMPCHLFMGETLYMEVIESIKLEDDQARADALPAVIKPRNEMVEVTSPPEPERPRGIFGNLFKSKKTPAPATKLVPAPRDYTNFKFQAPEPTKPPAVVESPWILPKHNKEILDEIRAFSPENLMRLLPLILPAMGEEPLFDRSGQQALEEATKFPGRCGRRARMANRFT